MSPWWLQQTGLALLVLTVLLRITTAKKDEVLYCSACRAIADELNYSISQTDPKKTIHVGGFRVQPDGSLRDKKVPFARSETHLTELLEGVCNSMSDYALHEDPETKEKSYKRFAPRSNGNSQDSGDFPDFNNFKFSGPEGSDSLKFACESIVEELEDDIISLFAHESDQAGDRLCGEISGHCKASKGQHKEL